MNFIDLGRQYDVIREVIDEKIKHVLESQHYIMGSEVKELETALAEFTGRKYCLTCGSGTEALQISMMAYDLKKTDAVFVPSFTFFASAESINLAGGTPVFVDSDRSFNMDPDSLKREIHRIEEGGMLNPRGIVAVDLFGRSADYDKILPIAEEYGLFVLEDAAQGFGGSLRGKRNGSFGDVSATSFFPAKPLGCYGDGGAIFTDDEELYQKMLSIRVHGQGSDKYDNIRLGLNGRMDTIQAAVVLAKLTVFEKELETRQLIADWYEKYIGDRFELPIRDAEHYSAWAQYTALAKDEEDREKIVNGLKDREIPAMIYYRIPLHQQTAYRKLGYEDVRLPYCEAVAKRVLSLPMHPYLTETEVKQICDTLNEL